MKTATMASSRTARGASVSLNNGLKIAFRSGAVMGLVVVGFGLLDIVLWFLILNYWVFTPEHMVEGWKWMGLTFVHPGTDQHGKMIEITATMLTFGMGASTQALFARVGGGIFTKAADVGADLVGKVEAGIPEDDPAILQPSLTTLVTMWVMWQVWVLTFMNHMQDQYSQRLPLVRHCRYSAPMTRSGQSSHR